MKEQQVQRKITPADLDRMFGTDKTEVTTQLIQEVLEACQQSFMQIRFGMTAREAEKLDHVGVAEYLQRCWVSLFQSGRDFCRLSHAALEQRSFELALQFTLRPPLLNRHTQVKLPFFRVFTLAEDDQVMGPG
ncbi:hypothetical protein D3C87_1326340 [compost metagenome]